MPPELQDDDWLYIVSEFELNYTTESIRESIYELRKKESEKVSDDTLRMLGYSEEDIEKNNGG